MARQRWVAVVEASAARTAIRAELREIPLPPEGATPSIPSPGDHVVILALPEAVFLGVGTATRVRSGDGRVLRLRDRIRAPRGHTVDPFALRPRPACTVAWTRERLAALAGSFIPVDERDGARIEAAIRTQALAFGPAATRPAHEKARTPGRRALLEGRAASGTLGGRR